MYFDLDKHHIIEQWFDDYDNLCYKLDYHGGKKEGNKQFNFYDADVEFIEIAPTNKIK
jgi:hypothetical protein